MPRSTENNVAAPNHKIILPGLLEIEFLPECQHDPEVKVTVEKIIYSGQLAEQMRAHGLSEHIISEYLAAVERRKKEVAHVSY